ncbi:MAG: endopeptidase La [Firmicutes bacterium]|nr:endopeptidase La [Bacillota bacterium]
MIENKIQDPQAGLNPRPVVGDWQILPAMPLRGLVVYPYMMTQLDVGRDLSINAVDEAMRDGSNLIFLAMQKDSNIDDPAMEDIHEIGTVCKICQVLKLPGGTVRLMVEGQYRARLLGTLQERPFIMAEISPRPDDFDCSAAELEAYRRIMWERFEHYAQESRRISPDMLAGFSTVEDGSQLVNLIAGQLNLSMEQRQQMLEILSLRQRIEKLLDLLDWEMEVFEMERSIANRTRQQMEKSQRDYYLREQIKSIQVELGEDGERAEEVAEYRAKAEAAQLPKHALDRFNVELKRLEKTPAQMAEANVIANYLDLLLDLPWNKTTEENRDIHKAQRILDADHYGLEKPKERILEYLASCQLKKGMKGPILCLVGPPGVGKTSLGRSIARATGREFVRLSLGGVRDEAEIRGHRRTYIGSMPGRILQCIKEVGCNHPLFLLDEVDKMASDWKGDPTSALLEALDPEQNSTFSDHYLEIPYDLSQVMFITTANYRSNIPAPLQDRMEIIEVSSYTEVEKLNIARKHLVPKQLAEHGIEKNQLKIGSPALKKLIRDYTREAGVRELERRIGKICRVAARDIVGGDPGPFSVTPTNMESYLGRPKYRDDKLIREPQVGVAIGLAWTEVGGEILQVEAQTIPGKGKFTITGQLGDVMVESVKAAYTYLRTVGSQYNIEDNVEEKTDIHVHVPEGAVPKDGPSAGVTITTALASQFSGRPVRCDVAMTGEISLHGRVLAVGGIKEKLLAAYRNGITEIILPKACERDLEDLPTDVREKMQFHLVEHLSQVLELALVK